MAFGTITKEILLKVRADLRGFKKVSEMTNKYINNTTDTMKNYRQASRSVVAANVKSQRSYRAFRFELLSTMFFGQMLQKTMIGLLNPAFETAGIFDIISTILEVFFLPIALALLDPLLAMMDWFLSMPEEVQLVIGAIVLFLAILGGIVAMVSQVGLLLGSFGMTFGSLGAMISTHAVLILGIIKTLVAGIVVAVTSAGTVTVAIVAGIILAIVAIFVAFLFNVEGFVKAFTDYFKNTAEALKNIWNGVVQIFTGIWKIIVGIFTGNQDLIKEGLTSFVNGIQDLLSGAWNLIIGNALQFAMDFGNAIVVGLGRAYEAIKGAIAGIPLIGPLLVGLMEGGEAIAGGIGGIVGGIGSAIGGAVGSAAKAIGGMIPGFADGGIVTRPTLAMVGEAGPEAIVPLNNRNGGSGTINYSPVYQFNNEINNSGDVDYLISEIERKQGEDYERLRLL